MLNLEGEGISLRSLNQTTMAKRALSEGGLLLFRLSLEPDLVVVEPV